MIAALARRARHVVGRRRALDLEGRTVIVTGGSRGLGLLLAERFVRHGANVAICGREADAVERAKRRLEAAGPRVLAIACDLGRRESAEAFVETVVRAFGRLDVVVNNAGRIQAGSLDAIAIDDLESMMDSNLWSAVHVTMSALPHLYERGSAARIVNVTSIGGRMPVPHLMPYVISKFALYGFSEALRAELARADAPRVVTVIPGLMRTGSYYNAEFLDPRDFAWFSVGASMPLLTLDADRAADRIFEATRDGRRFVRLGATAYVGEWAYRFSPRLATALTSLVSRLLPRGVRAPSGATKGRDVSSRLVGSAALRLGDRAALRNNEAPPTATLR
jgi:NAD(P)-dependent dehydrogenase (short-subunit alcohol dehydrogenase family)